MTDVETAVESLSTGEPVLVYDDGDREDEVDMVYAAEHVDYSAVTRLRNDAGGLICTAVPYETAESYGLPYMHDIVDPSFAHADLEYDTRSSFSIWVNHRSTRTGVTDRDRSTTIQELANAAEAAADDMEYGFAEEFRSPGHVAVLRADEDLLEGRQGHTEMAVELTREAKLKPAAVVCEMLDDTTGEALDREEALEYAEVHDLAFLEGQKLVDRAIA